MRTGFVLSTIALALALGFIAGISESRLLTRALIIGFAPAVWAASYAIERLTGRDMWHFTAPYPYPWMRENGDAASTPPNALGSLSITSSKPTTVRHFRWPLDGIERSPWGAVLCAHG